MNTILFSVSNRVGVITLNRPDKRNALNEAMINELSSVLDKAEADENIRAVIIKAAGNTFCSGADLDQLRTMQSNSFEENLEDSTRLKNLFLKIYKFRKIVVAQVEGFALAGGCGLATVCDFVFATPESKFGYTEARIGFVPAIVMVFLLRKLGERKAAELLLKAEIVTAQQALDCGLINYIVEKVDIEKTVNEFVQKLINTNSSQSMATTKSMMAEVQSLSLNDALDFAARQNALARSTEDCKKGIAAFLNKQDITW